LSSDRIEALSLPHDPRLERRKHKVPPDVTVINNLEFGTGGGRPLLLNLMIHKNAGTSAHPGIIYIHGGGWRAGNKNDVKELLPLLAENGFVVASIEYRLSGEAPFPAQIEDCKCAVRWMRAHADEYGIDPNRIGVVGLSAGGHLASLLGTTPNVADFEGSGGWQKESSRVEAVVDVSGPEDLLLATKEIVDSGETGPLELADPESSASALSHLLGGPLEERFALAQKASPIDYVSASSPPFLIIHGNCDTLVPLEQSRKFYEALKLVGVPADLVIVEGMHHMMPGDELDSRIIEFLDERLKPANRIQQGN
jgi:acetyl esterase/lipase